MKIERLPNGELRLALMDDEGCEMTLNRYEDDLLSIYVGDGIILASVDLSREQVRELLPHLAAFAATGSLEVKS